MDFANVEKELKLDLSSHVPESQDLSLDTDYLNFMENPAMEQYLNNYYYSSNARKISFNLELVQPPAANPQL